MNLRNKAQKKCVIPFLYFYFFALLPYLIMRIAQLYRSCPNNDKGNWGFDPEAMGCLLIWYCLCHYATTRRLAIEPLRFATGLRLRGDWLVVEM